MKSVVLEAICEIVAGPIRTGAIRLLKTVLFTVIAMFANTATMVIAQDRPPKPPSLEELQREELRLIEEERQYREEQAEREAERKRKLLEAREAAARRAREEEERVNARDGAGSRTLEQQRLKDLIEETIPLEIPDAAIIKPQNSGLLSIQPTQPSNPN